MILNQSEQKKLAASFAVNALFERGEIFSGMKIGLGTGSTAMPAVEQVAALVREGKLSGVKAVATSFQTEIACESLGIPVFSFNARIIGGSLDLAIDGADEVDLEGNLIKGGGAALLREKIIAYNAKKFVIVADETKAVASLGAKFALPVEVIPDARVSVTAAIQALGASPVLREGLRKCGPVITDNGNIIIDCLWPNPVDPVNMEAALNAITGVVENGFFTRNRPAIFIAHNDGTVEER
ncbi:MAG: ribose-5-phosphate isomerase RpiA [Treponemataceae bacterium]|nr:MAG: ribose-5-phosphate isomerase RpiA [Treponemataceae bacterium]